MRKFAAFIFLFTIYVISAMAQMQSQITRSSERTADTILCSHPQTIRTESYKEDKIVTLCKESTSGRYVFARTKDGSNNIEICVLTTVDTIANFRIYDDMLFFCGRMATKGYIAFVRVEDMFGGGQIGCNIIDNVYQVFDLEVYDHGIPKVSALANDSVGNYFLVDLNLGQSYDLYYIPGKPRCITQTSGFVSIAYSLPNDIHRFAMTRFDKNSFSLNTTMLYDCVTGGQFDNYADLWYKTFVATCDYKNDRIYVATMINGPNVIGAHRSIAVYGIDLTNNMQLYNAQVIPTPSKPEVRDIAFNHKSRTLHLLANVDLNTGSIGTLGSLAGDVIFDLDADANQNYVCNFTITHNVSSSNYPHTLNSITIYSGDNLYVVAGIDNSNRLYWFDKYYNAISTHCAKIHPLKIFLNTPSQTTYMPLTSSSFNCTFVSLPPFNTNTTYSIDCLD